MVTILYYLLRGFEGNIIVPTTKQIYYYVIILKYSFI